MPSGMGFIFFCKFKNVLDEKLANNISVYTERMLTMYDHLEFGIYLIIIMGAAAVVLTVLDTNKRSKEIEEANQKCFHDAYLEEYFQVKDDIFRPSNYSDIPYGMNPKDRYYNDRYNFNRFLNRMFYLYASNDWIKINYDNYQKHKNKYLIKEEWYFSHFKDELEKIAILYYEKNYGAHYNHFDIDEMKYEEWEKITKWHRSYVRNILKQPHLPKFPKDSEKVSDDEALMYRAKIRFDSRIDRSSNHDN